MKLFLHRDLSASDCSMGVFTVERVVLTLQTLERPWIVDPDSPGGLAGRSCVPLGTYELALHDTEAHHQTWALVNRSLGVVHRPDPAMPNARVACLIHPANHSYELRGCIAPGLIRNGHTVERSGDAFAELKAVVPWTSGHTLTITGG